MSKIMLDELKAAEMEKAEKEKKLKEEDKEVTDEVEEKPKTKEKEKENGKSKHDARDWKRNGLFVEKFGYHDVAYKFLRREMA